jgi:hypothetical protein
MHQAQIVRILSAGGNLRRFDRGLLPRGNTWRPLIVTPLDPRNRSLDACGYSQKIWTALWIGDGGGHLAFRNGAQHCDADEGSDSGVPQECGDAPQLAEIDRTGWDVVDEWLV